MRVSFHTLGCRVNRYDSDAMAALFARAGHVVVAEGEEADVCVVNTCSVTGESNRQCRQLIRRLRRRHPGAVLVVTGCFAQTAPGEVAALPGVDVVLGTADRARVVELAEAVRQTRPPAPVVRVGNVFQARTLEAAPVERGAEGRTRALLKVQEGCARMCAYCIVPLARGRPRSLPPAEVVREAAALAGLGFREVVVTGTDLGSYGRDLPGRPSLANLLRSLHEVEGLRRIRLSSVEPMDVDEELLAAVAELPRVCPHLHLPLQSGSDRVLARMRRRYRAADFRRLAERARELIPDLALGTDLIAGFPGEEEADHRATMELVRELGPARLHVFPYSPRPGTVAARFADQVAPAERRRRAAELAALGRELALACHRRLVGRVVEVLVEEVGEERATGYTPDYVRVNVSLGAVAGAPTEAAAGAPAGAAAGAGAGTAGAAAVRRNDMIPVLVEDASDAGVAGILVPAGRGRREG